jgi:hypothetical protein
MADLAELPKSETQLAADRMAAVERQLHKYVPQGVMRRILCPYCGTWNSPKGRTFCCQTLRHAIVTVLVADRALKQAATAERSMNN